MPLFPALERQSTRTSWSTECQGSQVYIQRFCLEKTTAKSNLSLDCQYSLTEITFQYFFFLKLHTGRYKQERVPLPVSYRQPNLVLCTNSRDFFLMLTSVSFREQLLHRPIREKCSKRQCCINHSQPSTRLF